jgi:hypothetical protein
MGEGERRGPSVDDDTGLRRDCCVGSRRPGPIEMSRSCGELQPWPRHGRLARSGPAAVHHRRQAEAALGSASGATDICTKHLIHGARAALPYVAERDTPLGRWAKALMMRAHHNVAVVAFANKHRRRLRGRRSDTKLRSATDVCERVTKRWPNSRTALRKPGPKTALDAASFMRTRARVSPSWPGRHFPRPDTLKQTD